LTEECPRFASNALPVVDDDDELNHQPWFFGDISRAEAEAQLSKHSRPGLFLVRTSSTGKDNFALSFLDDECVTTHVLITFVDDLGFCLDGKPCADTLFDLVKICSTPEQDWLPCPLLMPCPSPALVHAPAVETLRVASDSMGRESALQSSDGDNDSIRSGVSTGRKKNFIRRVLHNYVVLPLKNRDSVAAISVEDVDMGAPDKSNNAHQEGHDASTNSKLPIPQVYSRLSPVILAQASPLVRRTTGSALAKNEQAASHYSSAHAVCVQLAQHTLNSGPSQRSLESQRTEQSPSQRSQSSLSTVLSPSFRPAHSNNHAQGGSSPRTHLSTPTRSSGMPAQTSNGVQDGAQAPGSGGRAVHNASPSNAHRRIQHNNGAAPGLPEHSIHKQVALGGLARHTDSAGTDDSAGSAHRVPGVALDNITEVDSNRPGPRASVTPEVAQQLALNRRATINRIKKGKISLSSVV